IRELRNVIERALLLCEGGEITPEHLPLDKLRLPRLTPTAAAGVAPRFPAGAPLTATEAAERRRILELLSEHGGNQTRVAETLAGAVGCATGLGGLSARRDLHTSARVSGAAPRVLVTGPALLMHINVEGRDDLTVYAVARKTGTEADCTASQTGERKRVHPGVP